MYIEHVHATRTWINRLAILSGATVSCDKAARWQVDSQ